MKPSKRKKLEKAGFKVGTAQDFLGLSNEERALIDLNVRQLASSKRIDVGRVVDLENVKLVSARQPRYRPSELMGKFKRRHRHAEWEIGSPAGGEIW